MKNLHVHKMIKGNQRLNGHTKLGGGNKFDLLERRFDGSNVEKVKVESFYGGNIKEEPHEEEYDSKINLHSIIGLNNVVASHKSRPKKSGSYRHTHHETLQRIAGSDISEEFNQYQKHWFSAGLERLKLEDRSREERLEITRYELKRHLKQLVRSNVGKDSRLPPLRLSHPIVSPCTSPQKNDRLVAPRSCEASDCGKPALACARHCTLHIMHNPDQVLFSNCTAKFADNTQCSVPVFDILHELPLCVEHARKRDNYKMFQETKPKKLRKKVKPSAMIRPQKRTKKRKKPEDEMSTEIETDHGEQRLVRVPSCNVIEETEITDDLMTEVVDDSEELGEDMVEQVLALQEPDALELANVDQVLVTQASHLLEETDITNVLSTIQADEFNDFFTVNRNGEYEPTREETEELERALAAVDNDVKSLEKLSQSQGLLDTFLDDHNLVESLVQSSIVPDVFHNGYSTCGENALAVGPTTSRLLSVQPHSHS